MTTAVIADDTDIFQQMLYHADDSGSSFDMFMITSQKNINITELRRGLDPVLIDSILFIHSISGCDTTSRPYGIGKATAIKYSSQLSLSATVFNSPESTKEDIRQAGEIAILALYGSPESLTLNKARVDKFLCKVANSIQYVSPEKKPLTA